MIFHPFVSHHAHTLARTLTSVHGQVSPSHTHTQSTVPHALINNAALITWFCMRFPRKPFFQLLPLVVPQFTDSCHQFNESNQTTSLCVHLLSEFHKPFPTYMSIVIVYSAGALFGLRLCYFSFNQQHQPFVFVVTEFFRLCRTLFHGHGAALERKCLSVHDAACHAHTHCH